MTHTLTFSIKNAYAFLLVLLLCSVFTANAQRCSWARGMGCDQNDLLRSVVADAAGDTYVAGAFSADSVFVGTTLFKPDSLFGAPDIFLVKHNTDGHIVWAETFGEPGLKVPTSLVIDRRGNLYLCGVFIRNALSVSGYTFDNISGYDAFISKINADGTVIWTKTIQFEPAAHGDHSRPVALAVDSIGNVIVTGIFQHTMTIGSHTLSSGASEQEIFIAKYDSSGDVVWAQNTIGTGYDYVTNMTADQSGNIFVSGYGSFSISFGAVSLTYSTSSNFLVKYDAGGVALWARTIGYFDIHGTPITTDASGYLYMVGNFASDTITFDAFALTNASPGRLVSDVFVAKLDHSGSFMWAKSLGGTDRDGAANITADPQGNIFIGGWSISSSLAIGTTTIAGSGAFVAKYSSSGIPMWGVGQTGSIRASEATMLTVDASGNLYVAGIFDTAATFDSFTVTDCTQGTVDIFLAKYNDPTAAVENVNDKTVSAQLYPNPAENEITIFGTQPLGAVVIATITGQVVHRRQYGTEKVTIGVSNLPPGLYLVRVNDTQTLKFVKQ